MDHDAILQASGWFGRQPAGLRRILIREGRVVALKPGRWLHGEGDETGGIVGVLSGGLKLMAATTAADGREALIDVAGPGSFFGQTAFLGGGPRLVTAIAAEASSVLHVSDHKLQQIAVETPELWRALSELLYGQLARTVRLAAEAIVLAPPERLAARLAALSQVNRVEPDAWLPLSQTDLAEMTGLSRKTVNAQLRRWSRAGFVETGYRSLRIIAPQALAALVAAERPL